SHPRPEPSATAHAPSRPPTIPRTPPALPVSRRGGAALLAAIVVVVVIAVVLLTSSGGSSSDKSRSSASTAKASTSAKTPKITKQITLTPPEPASKAIGIVEVLTEGSQHAFYIATEHLPPSNGSVYVIWLYSSPSHAEAVSKSPTVGSNGRMQGGALLPVNAGQYHEILLTRETVEHPTHPGPIVLSGPFSLGR
ncbi:MAG TPA: anti-sigma factor, partial [Solirubrobacteraceae bacterium]|nr:anti-sigma factor [Solirubrobacteraceae bacterium]